MSITISATLFGKLECRMDDLRAAIAEGEMGDAQKMMERMMKAFVEIRGTASSGPAVASDTEPVKTKKGRKAKTDADGEPKPKRAPTEWSLHCTNVLFPLIIPAIKEAKAAESAKSGEKREFKKFGFHLNVAGYLKNSGKMNPTEKEVKEAIEFLLNNPDHKSQTEISRSAGNSTDEKPKARGRPKKAAAAAAATPAAVKASEVIAMLEAALSESDEEEDSDDEEEEEEVPLTAFEYKGNNYLKDTHNEVYTAEGKMEWLGTFNGKKILKGDMPVRVKKFIESQD